MKPSVSEAPLRTGGIEARGFVVVPLLALPTPVAHEVVAAAELALVVAAAVAPARPELELLPQPTSATDAKPIPIQAFTGVLLPRGEFRFRARGYPEAGIAEEGILSGTDMKRLTQNLTDA